MQELIMPINQAFISASFLNEKYMKKFGFAHYGVDFAGSHKVWGSGYGICIFKGTCALYGNYLSVFYPFVNAPNNAIIANYFHLKDVYAAKGDIITKDSCLGISGQTGKYATGPHLHFETYSMPYLPKTPISAYRTPFVSAMPDVFINPLTLLQVKSTPPDNQVITFSNDGFTNEEDKLREYERN